MTLVPMTVFLPLLFAGAAAIACGIIGLTLKRYAADIRALRMALTAPAGGSDIRITYRRDDYDADAVTIDALRTLRRKRHHDIRATKWTMHRLHHFTRHQTAA